MCNTKKKGINNAWPETKLCCFQEDLQLNRPWSSFFGGTVLKRSLSPRVQQHRHEFILEKGA